MWASILFAVTLVDIQGLIDKNQLAQAETEARAFVNQNPRSADGRFLLGYVLFREAKPKESLDEYRAGAKIREPQALDYGAMGSDAFLLEDYTGADGWLSKAVEKDATNATLWYQLGRARYNEKHFAQATDALQQCLKIAPENARAQDYLGRTLERLGKTDDALAAYRKAGAEALLDLGTLLVENDRAKEAVVVLEKAPKDAEAHRELGKAYIKLNRLEQAQGELEEAVRSSPENAPSHFLLAQVYRKRGMTAKADAETARYGELTGTHSTPETPLSEARTMLDTGKLADAEAQVRRYLSAHAQSGEGHFLLGYVLFKRKKATESLREYTEGAKYQKPAAADLEVVASDYVVLKDYPDADKWYTKAVEWNPQDALGWYYLGRTKYNENRFDEAVKAFQKCLTLKARDVKAEDNLGLAYEGLNQVDQAMAAYRTAIEWQKNVLAKDAGPYLDLGNLLVDNGHPDEGLPSLLAAERMAPDDFRTHRALGKAYEHLDEPAKAREELERAAKLAPEDAPIHFVLAQVYRKLGLTEKAKEESEKYTKLTGAGSAPEK